MDGTLLCRGVFSDCVCLPQVTGDRHVRVITSGERVIFRYDTTRDFLQIRKSVLKLMGDVRCGVSLELGYTPAPYIK